MLSFLKWKQICNGVNTEENAFLILKREINLYHSISVPPKHFQIQ